jgi:uncharacterized protein (DUF952 family)
LLRRRLLRLMRILHVALADDWAAAEQSGTYQVSSRNLTLAQEGFIHASTTVQVPGVLAGYYTDLDPAELRLLVIDIATLDGAGSPVQWDVVPGAPYRFPHIYGPIIPAAVVAVLPLGGEKGAPELPDLTGLDVTSDQPT